MLITPTDTPRLTLRRFRPADAADPYEYLADPETYRFEPGEPLDRVQAAQRTAEMAASPDFWAVALRATGKVIGQLYLKQIEPPEHLTCELGYILSPAYQRQGYGAEAAAALVRQALTAGGMHRIVAHCNPENSASWRLLERIGFRREALHRQDIFFRRDAAGAPLWTDTYVYALLAAEAIGPFTEQAGPTMPDHARSSPLSARYAHTNLTAADIIRADFDRLARYDTDDWSHNGHYHGFLLRQLPVSCEAVLEIGCGTGGLARQLAARAGQVLALDLSPAMIRIAQARSAGCANIDYRVADVLAWDWPAERFDGIISVATLHHLPLAEILPRLRDALKPGGVLVVLDLFKSAGPRDRLLDALALPVSAVLSLLKNGRLRESPEVRAAWDAHGQHDAYLTLAEIRQACADILPGARVRRHLLRRYSLVWRKPAS